MDQGQYQHGVHIQSHYQILGINSPSSMRNLMLDSLKTSLDPLWLNVLKRLRIKTLDTRAKGYMDLALDGRLTEKVTG